MRDQPDCQPAHLKSILWKSVEGARSVSGRLAPPAVPALAVRKGLVGRLDMKIVRVTLNRQGCPAARSGFLVKSSSCQAAAAGLSPAWLAALHPIRRSLAGDIVHYRFLYPGTSRLPGQPGVLNFAGPLAGNLSTVLPSVGISSKLTPGI